MGKDKDYGSGDDAVMRTQIAENRALQVLINPESCNESDLLEYQLLIEKQEELWEAFEGLGEDEALPGMALYNTQKERFEKALEAYSEEYKKMEVSKNSPFNKGEPFYDMLTSTDIGRTTRLMEHSLSGEKSLLPARAMFKMLPPEAIGGLVNLYEKEKKETLEPKGKVLDFFVGIVDAIKNFVGWKGVDEKKAENAKHTIAVMEEIIEDIEERAPKRGVSGGVSKAEQDVILVPTDTIVQAASELSPQDALDRKIEKLLALDKKALVEAASVHNAQLGADETRVNLEESEMRRLMDKFREPLEKAMEAMSNSGMTVSYHGVLSTLASMDEPGTKARDQVAGGSQGKGTYQR